ncbi:hypothetical protein HPB51_004810 [Rhipicephalus microplus]|uniref:Tick transposon n=1 Tax=Rhipicephalus microplus TaxID=6941 RepID=A0A9J6E6V7_RHIMP|nr:hypothetical protein HPB51_004810 [Rhipicephalus microplus]
MIMNALSMHYACQLKIVKPAYHGRLQHERNKTNAIRRAYITALCLFESASTTRLLQLGIHNTLGEIAEAQRTAQLERLSMAKAGRRILEDLGIGCLSEAEVKLPVSEEVRCQIRTDAILKSKNFDHNKGRRVARARAIIDRHANDAHAKYVNTDQYQQNAWQWSSRGRLRAIRTAESVKNSRAEQEKKAAIALAIADTACHTVLSDSRQAV